MPGSKRRARQTVRYQEWMSAQVRELNADTDNGEVVRVDEISRAVREALGNLSEKERTAVEEFHFMGTAPEEVALELCVTKRGLERILRRAKLKLQTALYQFAKNRWQIKKSARKRKCALCESPNRIEIERLLQSKAPDETWRRIMHQLRERFGISVPAPQSIIGHVRYHNVLEIQECGTKGASNEKQ